MKGINEVGALGTPAPYQCRWCGKFCAADGSWIKIHSFDQMRSLLAATPQPIDCLLCAAGFHRQASSCRQLPPGDR